MGLGSVLTILSSIKWVIAGVALAGVAFVLIRVKLKERAYYKAVDSPCFIECMRNAKSVIQKNDCFNRMKDGRLRRCK